MKLKLIACTAIATAAFPTGAYAQESDNASVETREPVVVSDYQPPGSEAQVVIRPGGEGKVFYEYRVNGELVEIKVVPDVGPEYYLVPADGGGWIREDSTELLVPSWVLFRW